MVFMKTNKINWLYYLLFFFIGFFIYNFQIEKSFNLLTIYLLCISFSFFCFLFKIDSKKILPFLFVCSLFAMYGVNNQDGFFEFQLLPFIILLSVFTIALFILLSRFNLLLKKIVLIFIAIVLAS